MPREPATEECPVSLVTDEDLARARQDPAFRYELVVGNLRMLLDEINKMRAVRSDALDCKEIREGVRLAVQLSELLQRINGRGASAPGHLGAGNLGAGNLGAGRVA
jgi:hypothetical protein